jgi:hypothetical protein
VRIERHQVGDAAVTASREDFVDRIGAMVRSMSRGGLMTACSWQMIADEFLDYLGALSVRAPRLDTPEAEAVLRDAAEAAAGAVRFAAYHGYDSFHVFLDYVNFGMGYERDADRSDRACVTLAEWLDAYCLAVIGDRTAAHGEAFHFARQDLQEGMAGRPAAELVGGFLAYVSGDLGDDTQSFPPSREEKLTALDAALGRIRDLAGRTGEPLLEAPYTRGLRTLRALTAGDEETYAAELTRLLRAYADHHPGPAARPSTLLPLLPIALAALGHRDHGWRPPVETDYLPHALVTGFDSAGPRVGAFGADRRPDAVAELAAAEAVVLERPPAPQPVHPDAEAHFERSTREAYTPAEDGELDPWNLSQALRYQEILFKTRASRGPDVTDVQLRGVRLASQLGAALFRTARAEPGTRVEVTIDGRTLTYPAARRDHPGLGHWLTATHLALITGVREDLAALVLAGTARLDKGAPTFSAYAEALHAYLRGDEAADAAECAVGAYEKARTAGFVPPPAVLLSQLVEGDEESFNLALLDALEAHRDHYRVADRAEDCDAALDLGVLALACHARRRGWRIRVASPYLPARLLEAARPL